ncbi:dipeptide/oligopeptide/nickel ABC transporter ATP-binding protein [Microlunatus endophyticus]|uniref:Dipeptide/oligopeptide/nickel ABC transporter ATP-binding protein n=1 Tax=Microlunatus endophyticus TaxID=1716077 RepID=A0A917S2J4_9ACTN|nr:ABC transporter ATP-binding protein [Microlunatus endophyticus]GGL50847.1 dipeptide/oligopeptide/nickel ABC transporter ATP-binding protein [Microlunatus endophyticus]
MSTHQMMALHADTAGGGDSDARQQAPAILEVDNLSVNFGPLRAVDGVSLTVREGDIYALAGESGCGKSTLAYSLLGMVPPPGVVSTGQITFRGHTLTGMDRRKLDQIRGAEISMVFQAAMNAFNPVITIGTQVEHVLQAHPDSFPTAREGREYFEYLLRLVRLDPEVVWKGYESRLSGGMKQRVAIALGLLLRPSVLVLDEPTTALDILNQRLVIDILNDLHETLGVTIIFITHDLALVAELANRVAVMYAGRLVETGTIDEIFYDERRHPYVSALIRAVPSVTADTELIKPIPGRVPSLAELPPGCRFAPRCAQAIDICQSVDPPLLLDAAEHGVACHVVNAGLSEKGLLK